MSEYWKSTPRYWCKHCKTFVVDTKLSRTQHEATSKHQGALNRFLRDLHRANERETHSRETAKREVARLNALISGNPLPHSTSPTTAATSSKPTTKWAAESIRPLSGKEQEAQLKQLESLGVALPEEFRKEVALPGEWQYVGTDADKKPLATLAASKSKQAEQESKARVKEEILKKRKREEEDKRWAEMDQDERAMRSFKVETKTYPGDAVDGGDLDELLGLGKGKGKAKGKAKGKESLVENEQDASASEHGAVIKKEEADDEEAQEEPEPPPRLGDGVAFKKRKVKNLRKR